MTYSSKFNIGDLVFVNDKKKEKTEILQIRIDVYKNTVLVMYMVGTHDDFIPESVIKQWV